MKTLIIDSMNTAFRTYLKLPPFTNQKGIATNVIYGFLMSIQSLYKQFNPENLILVWDGKKSKVIRRNIDPDYKANRHKDMDDKFIEFLTQLTILKKELPLMGIPNIEIEKYESDDIMAILASRKKHLPAIIATGDNDLLQTLTDDVTQFDGKKLWTTKIFESQYSFPVELFVIYKAVIGCRSDNVKGVYKIGNKKVLNLFKQHNYDIEKILKAIDNNGWSTEFDKALSLVSLPFNYNYNIKLDTSILNIDRKKLQTFLYKYDINSININTFLQNNFKPT